MPDEPVEPSGENADVPVPFRLGLQPPDPSKPRLRLSPHLLAEAVPAAPESQDYLSEVDEWPMYANDRIGDCGPAMCAHGLTAISTYGSGRDIVPDLPAVVDLYSRVSGYDPKTGANDNGVILQDLLSHWRKGGLRVPGGGVHKIVAFAEVNLRNAAEVRAALHLFGALMIGADLPLAAADQLNAGKPWDVSSGWRAQRGSWGGHAVHVGRYTAGRKWCTTWGQEQELTDAWWNAYVGEAWVVITEEWLRDNGRTPTGLDLRALGEDFTALTGEPNPFPDAPAGGEPGAGTGGASFPVSAEVAARVARSAARAKVTPQAWIEKHLRSYFRLGKG